VDVEVPCRAEARGWILAATILGSSMAFIDSTYIKEGGTTSSPLFPLSARG